MFLSVLKALRDIVLSFLRIMIKVAKVPKLIIKIIKTLLENCKNNQKISLKNLDFMPNLRQNATNNLTVRIIKGE